MATWDHFRKSPNEHNLTVKKYRTHEETTHYMPQSLDKKHSRISTPRISNTGIIQKGFKMIKS